MLCEFVADNQGELVCRNCARHAKKRTLRVFRLCAAYQPSGLAGTHLKMLLSRFGISVSPGCKCNVRANHMNRMGDDWCEENIETIVEWLKEEALARGLPFISTVGRMIVRRAIQNARKEAKRATEKT